MKSVRFLGFFVFFLLSLEVMGQSSFVKVQKKQEMLVAGQTAFVNRCSGCHGVQGDGKGPSAKMLNPRPRDFTKGIFKFKTTPIGEMPSDEDLLKVINEGVPGTSMPSFILVSEGEKRALVEYIKSFAQASWQRQSPEKVIPSLKIPQRVFTQKTEFLASAKNGRLWFQELGCVSCHGVAGLGDGPSSTNLKDAWSHDIKPANLRQRFVKRGYTVQDVAYSIANGVDGTPMPAHADVLESLEAQFPELKDKSYIWELTAFVFYLRGQEAGIYTNEIATIPADGIPHEEVMQSIGKYFQ